MSDLQIRAATHADVQAVLTFWKESAEGTSVSDDVDDVDGVTRLVERDPGALLLALVDGVVVGSVIAGWDGWRASLYRLAVLPSHRRRGISSALLRTAEERFLALGGRRVDAMVLEANATGRALWEAAGYRREDHWRRWVKPLAR
ncbi:GNAT family N-acetyltransferase [Streptomyces sp. NPDC058877]|uniref:GNAT family N-acetyltransferase n=1 Tax=Streptomyces sp. NPDC058877 TaxID=3346665 RepID=UPI0036CA7E58